jgi:hypothetical protein
LANRFQYGNDVVQEVRTLVQNEHDLQALQALDDSELLADEARYMQPTYEHLWIENDVERFTETFETEFEARFPNLIGQLSGDQAQSFVQLVDLASTGVIDSARIQGLAMSLGLENSLALEDAFVTAAQRAVDSHQATIDALDADRLTPGSEAMAFAAQNAAIDDGWDPQLANLFGNSIALHAIIREKSNGVAGFEGEGTIRGIGGLTEDTYRIMMGEEWTPDRGMQWELTALARWLEWGFNGRITDAIQYYYQTGDWGGTSALPDVTGNGTP